MKHLLIALFLAIATTSMASEICTITDTKTKSTKEVTEFQDFGVDPGTIGKKYEITKLLAHYLSEEPLIIVVFMQEKGATSGLKSIDLYEEGSLLKNVTVDFDLTAPKDAVIEQKVGNLQIRCEF